MPARRRRLTRRDLDARLGYTGLGVGAIGFVLVLVASFVVIEVAPRIDVPQTFSVRGQSVVRYPALEAEPAVERVSRATRAASADRGRPALPPRVPDPVVPSPGAPGDTPTDNGWGDHDGGGPPPPRPSIPGVQGPVSQTLDPVVDGLTGALDDTTGGATAPVTGPVRNLADDVSDLGDGLLPRP